MHLVKTEKEIDDTKSSNKNKSNILVNNKSLLSVKHRWIHIAEQENAENIPTAKNYQIKKCECIYIIMKLMYL